MQRPDVIAYLSNKRAHFREKKFQPNYLSFSLVFVVTNSLVSFIWKWNQGKGPYRVKKIRTDDLPTSQDSQWQNHHTDGLRRVQKMATYGRSWPYPEMARHLQT
jgi:hypothetical protein